MITRIITAVVALAVFVAVLMAPPIVFTLALAAVILVMLWECYSATKADTATRVVGFVSAILMMIAAFSGSSEMDMFCMLLIPAIVVVVLLHMVLIVFKHGKILYTEILSNGFMTLYVVLSMGCLWFAKEMLDISIMILIFVCAWSTDTFAYFTGCLLGKHKLIPHVSPKKTIEGAVGGVVGAAIACIIYVFILNKFFVEYNSLISYEQAVIFGIIGGALSQLGDLIASSIKRDAGIKDFGWIFPGHGGFMDRFDSVMFIAPVYHIMLVVEFFIVSIGN